MSIFVRVADSGSFAAAARHFGLSPASISSYIRRLEERLNARLLNRTTRSVSLTEIGNAFYDSAKRILTELEIAEDVAGRLQVEPRGVLRVNTAPSFAASQMVPAICDFMARFPQVSVEMTVTPQHVDLVDEGIDIAVRGHDAAVDTHLTARRLAPVRFIVTGAPSYFRRRGVPQRPADLLTHNCLTLVRTDYASDWHFVAVDGSETWMAVRGDFQSNAGAALRLAALRGKGLIYQPSYLVGDDLRAGRLEAVLSEWTHRDAGLIAYFPHGRLLAAKTRAFIDFLAERFGGGPFSGD